MIIRARVPTIIPAIAEGSASICGATEASSVEMGTKAQKSNRLRLVLINRLVRRKMRLKEGSKIKSQT